MSIVELRCSEPPGQLLAKMRLAGKRPVYLMPDNLIELHCRYCTTRVRRDDPAVVRVVHRFNVVGEYVESEALYGDG